MNWKQAQGVKMAEPIRKGVSWASLLAVLMGVGIIAYLTWQSTKKTDTTNYAKGADHTETNLTVAPVEHNYPLALPRCGRLFSIDPNWAASLTKEQPKGKK